jgi:hypothetical protein
VSLASQSTGALVISGEASTLGKQEGSVDSVFVERVTAAGAPDKTFGSKDEFSVRLRARQWRGLYGLSVLPDDRVLVACRPDRRSFQLDQLTPAGSLDRSFGNAGRLTISAPEDRGTPASSRQSTVTVSLSENPTAWATSHAVAITMVRQQRMWAGLVSTAGTVRGLRQVSTRRAYPFLRTAEASDGSVFAEQGDWLYHLNALGRIDHSFDRRGVGELDLMAYPEQLGVDARGRPLVLEDYHGPIRWFQGPWGQNSSGESNAAVLTRLMGSGPHAPVEVAPRLVRGGAGARCGSRPRLACRMKICTMWTFRLRATSADPMNAKARVFLEVGTYDTCSPSSNSTASNVGTVVLVPVGHAACPRPPHGMVPIMSVIELGSWSGGHRAATTQQFRVNARHYFPGLYEVQMWRSASATSERSNHGVVYVRVVCDRCRAAQ